MIIAVDTGNRFIKTAHAEPFTAGLNRHYSNPPIVATDTLFYNGNYYSFSETQGYHRKDKTIDDYYFILSLAAIAREIVMKTAMEENPDISVDFNVAMRNADRTRRHYVEDVFLSVGLPPRDMKMFQKEFSSYFLKDGRHLNFSYNNITFDITIVDVVVSPQGFAAIFPNDLFSSVAKYPQSYIIDIGGYTTDVAKIVNKRIDTNYFESLDFGVIHMYNEVASVVAKSCSKDINGVFIEAILHGESVEDEEVEAVVRKAADEYAHKIIDALRDKGVDFNLSLPVLVGGGVQLLQESLRDAINRKNIFIIPDVKANAIGYEVLAKRILKERRRAE